MSSKISKKLKKPIDLPLGKASSQKEVDLSHVRLPIDTSVFGFKQVLALFETATKEVKNYLAYECDLMYECRLCRTIFRSIANFILHKRKYCREKYTPSEDPAQKCRETNGMLIIQKDIEIANKIIVENKDSKNTSGHHLNPIIEKLMKNQEHRKFVETLKNENLSDKSKPEAEERGRNKSNLLLETIDTSNVAVFQTATVNSSLGDTEFMKSEVMEIHSIFDKDEAIIGSDGKVLFSNNTKKEEKSLSKYTLTCTECKLKFSTKKTLAYHVKYKHNNSKLVYPCPICDDTLANAWSVYRHLLKIHRKTSTQIRKYRNIIHNSATCKGVEELPTKMRKEIKEVAQENDEENEWLDNVEGDNDLQMCGGCGKRFERKAALISHSIMCTKRIALCNSIKENNVKKKEADDRESKLKEKTLNKPPVIGAAKRKPENLITYKPKIDHSKIDNNTMNEKRKSDTEEGRLIKVEFSKQLSGEIITIISDDDNNTNDISTEFDNVTEKLDKKREHSSVGIALSHSDSVESPSRDSEENFSSELSNRSGSPCKGFEDNQPLRLPDITQIFSVEKNKTRISDCHKNISIHQDHISQDVESAVSDCVELKVREVMLDDIGYSENTKNDDAQTASTTEVDFTSNSIDIAPVLYLNNNISDGSLCENIELTLCDYQSNYSQDASFTSVIKNIIDRSDNQIMNEKFRDEFENTDFRESGVIADKHLARSDVCNADELIFSEKEFSSSSESLSVNDCEDQKNHSVDSKRTSGTKRRRIDSTKNDLTNKKLVALPTENDVALNEIEDEIFISRITPYTDMPNLWCSLCSSQFSTLSHLLLHMSIHFSWYRYQCSKCSFMSYNKCDCESHVHKEHQISFSQIQNTVLPIPTWKTATISDNVIDLESTTQSRESLHSREDQIQLTSNKSINLENKIDLKFEPVKYGKSNGRQTPKSREIIVGYIDLTSEGDDKVQELIEENVVENNIVAINKEENNSNTSIKDIGLFNSQKKYQLSPDMSKQAILEVILGDDHKKERYENIDQGLTTEYVRAPRNRVKSIKTSQKDFIYELNIVRNKSLK